MISGYILSIVKIIRITRRLKVISQKNKSDENIQCVSFPFTSRYSIKVTHPDYVRSRKINQNHNHKFKLLYECCFVIIHHKSMSTYPTVSPVNSNKLNQMYQLIYYLNPKVGQSLVTQHQDIFLYKYWTHNSKQSIVVTRN